MALITWNEEQLAIGAKMPDFEVQDTDGRSWTSGTFLAGSQAGIIFFTCNHCPYVQAYEERFIALAKRTLPLGVAWLALNPNAANPAYEEDSIPEMKKRARAKGYPFPYAADSSQAIAHAFGAACTPEFYLFSADGVLRYAGRVDDEQNERQVSKTFLADAIEAVLAGRPVAVPRAPLIGCSIKWLG